ADLLHLLIERAAAWDVSLLDDLLALPTLAGHPQGAKLRLTRDLPRGPGVYVLRDGQGDAVGLGHAADLRRAVRSLFSAASPRGTGGVLRATQAVEAVPCATAVEAAVTALRLG